MSTGNVISVVWLTFMLSVGVGGLLGLYGHADDTVQIAYGAVVFGYVIGWLSGTR